MNTAPLSSSLFFSLLLATPSTMSHGVWAAARSRTPTRSGQIKPKPAIHRPEPARGCDRGESSVLRGLSGIFRTRASDLIGLNKHRSARDSCGHYDEHSHAMQRVWGRLELSDAWVRGTRDKGQLNTQHPKKSGKMFSLATHLGVGLGAHDKGGIGRGLPGLKVPGAHQVDDGPASDDVVPLIRGVVSEDRNWDWIASTHQHPSAPISTHQAWTLLGGASLKKCVKGAACSREIRENWSGKMSELPTGCLALRTGRRGRWWKG